MNNWDLAPLYKNSEELDIDIEKTKNLAIKFENSYKTKLNSLDKNEFIKSLNGYENILEGLGRCLTYAFLIFATDSNKGGFLAKYQKLGNDIEEKLLFFELEFNEISKDKQDEIIKISGIKSFYLENLQKEKKFQLTLKEEKILLKKDLTSSSAFSRLFDEHTSRLKFNFQGKEVSEEIVLSELYNADREIRKEASESLTNGFKPSLNILAYIFNMIKTDLKIECDIRDYSSVEEPRHLSNKISKQSVDALIDATMDNTKIVKDYYQLKKEILKIDTIYDYDRYAPIGNSKDEYDYEKSKKIVLDAFKNFDEEFYQIAKKAFDENWIDVYPKENKRGGAFSHSAVPSAHPYVLLNHTNRRRDVFTLAHELGHAIHQYLSQEVGYLCSDTPLTTSETASIFAEMMVFDYIKNGLSKEESISLYGGKLEDIFATLFRQITFTTFERGVHSFENELNVDDFNKIWYEENQKMFGDSVELTENYKTWWCYIPHFIHSPFYCYAYSYGQLLVLALYGLYKNSKDKISFKDNYKTFLKAGGSKSPKELISLFGFNIDDKEFWNIGLKEIYRLVDEFKNILNSEKE